MSSRLCVRMIYESQDYTGDLWIHNYLPETETTTPLKTDAELQSSQEFMASTVPLLGQEARFVGSERMGLCPVCQKKVKP